MKQQANLSRREFWLKSAGRVRRRVNLAWWLETLSAPLLVLSLAGAAVLLWVRREMPAAGPVILPSIAAGAVILLGLICLARAARRFERAEDSLVRIEAAMRMRNGLSAAEAGVAPWPSPVARVDAGLRWQWPRILVPVVGSLVLLAAGLWMPVGARMSDSARPGEPQAWRQLSAEIEYLAEEQLVEENYLDELRKQLEELRARNEDQWFSHSSLEATDSLLKGHRMETERLSGELERAENALEKLEANQVGPAEKDRLMEEYEQALQGLQNGMMKPNAELLAQLGGLDLQDLEAMDPAQLAELKEMLEKHLEGLQGLKGEGEGEGEEGEGEAPPDGNGGIDRGPGHAPGVLGPEVDPLEIGEAAPLPTGDLSETAAGDLLEITDGEHETDTSASRSGTGGTAGSSGKGGERIWRESLDPDEQRVLKRFFE